MVRSSWRAVPLRILVAVGCAAVLAVGTVAAAASDDRSTTEALLKEVSASPRKDVADAFVARSRAALERAARLRASGDEAHAKIADGVARSWAEAARDVSRAAVVEESAAAARRAATDAGIVADRERALLEEAIAQSGRLRAQLDAVEREGKDQPARTSTAAVGGDAGARAVKPSPPPKDVKTPAPKGGAR